jgi:hypothetical protein
MSFREKVDEHIEETLMEGVLPDVDDVLEIEVPNQKSGPQASGDGGGPKSARAREATFTDHTAPPNFGGASRDKKFPCPPFSNANRSIPPAKFGGAAKIKEEAIQAVLADLEAMQDAE